MSYLKTALFFLSFVFGFSLISAPSQAFMMVPHNLKNLVKSCGVNSTWIEGEVIDVKAGRDPNGWPYSIVTVQGNILKQPGAKDRQDTRVHPFFGLKTRKMMDAQPNIVKFKMFGHSGTRQLMRGIEVPGKGLKGVFGISGFASGTGNSGFCGTAQQGMFEQTEVDGKQVLSNRTGNEYLGLQNLQLKTGTMGGKSLGVLKNLKKPSQLPKQEFLQVLQGVISEEFPKGNK